jgi:hypothetical protein
MALSLSSAAFSSNGPIPTDHTCDGAGKPPPLEWSGAPKGLNDRKQRGYTGTREPGPIRTPRVRSVSELAR